MATTRSEAAPRAQRWAREGDRARSARRAIESQGHSLVLACVCLLAPAAASSQTWRVEPSTKATVTATNNSGFASSVDSGGDVILDLTPRVAVTGRGASYTLSGFAQATSLSYARESRPNEFIPSAQIALNANPVDRWLYFDAAAGVSQASVDPYSVVSNGALPEERLQTVQYRLSPYLDHAFTPAVSLQYRNDNVWTRRTGAAATIERRGKYELHSHTLVFAQRPEPLGFAIEGNQQASKYTSDPNSTLELASARFVLSYAADPTLILGAVAGRERSEFALIKTSDSIRGLRLRWLPTERSDLNVSVERRFFSDGWDVSWSHRSPFLAMNLSLARQPSSQPSSFLLPNTGGDLRTLVDAAYTTRFPNPVERAAIVDLTLANLGTTGSTAEAIEIYSDYAQLVNRAEASVVLLSPRSALTFRVFRSKAEQLQHADILTPVNAVPTVADNVQTGASVAFNRRLTTTLSVESVLASTRIVGLGDSTGDSTSSHSIRLAGNQALNPKTRVVAGGRVQRAKQVQFNRTTSVETRNTVSEIAGFLGLEHKF
jgi:uncharacterized protein (PEP-CTERM system associated)